MAIGNKCEKCGSSMEFNPSTGGLICRKCGNVITFDSSDKYQMHSFSMETDAVEPEFVPEVVSSHCSNCGAIYGADTTNIADKCDYCGAHLIRDFSLSKESEPDACIPFAFDKETAKEKFKIGLKSKRFLPTKFKKEFNDSNIESVYIPAYLFNVDTQNEYLGRLYNTYKNSDGSSYKRFRNISGNENMFFDDILVECSSQMNQLTLDRIRPFDITQMKTFKNEFLLGYSVEYYDKKLSETKSLINETVKVNVRRRILRNYNYDGVDYLNIKTTYTDCKYARVILPTYKFTYRYGEKEYNTFINGQTGKVGGNLPRSKFKIISTIIGILGVVGLLIYFILK